MTLIGYIRVCRPPLMVLGAIAPISLYFWTHRLLDIRGLLIFLTVFSGNLGWTLANEYMDVDTDAINKPEKPLPSGEVDQIDVARLMGVLIFLSWIFNVCLLLFHPIYLIGFVGQATSFMYNVVRKDLFGNICMATTYGIGAFLSLYPHYLLFCLPFAMFTLAHNLNNQYQDFEAEQTAGVVTVPQQLGVGKTWYLSWSLLCFALGLFVNIFRTTGYPPILMFLAVTVTTMISTLSMSMEKETAYWVIENVARRLGRFLLIIGFLTMILL